MSFRIRGFLMVFRLACINMVALGLYDTMIPFACCHAMVGVSNTYGIFFLTGKNNLKNSPKNNNSGHFSTLTRPKKKSNLRRRP